MFRRSLGGLSLFAVCLCSIGLQLPTQVGTSTFFGVFGAEMGPSAQSHDYFRVNRSQLDSRVVDAELPIDSALAAVDRAVPGGGFLS